MSRNFFLRFFLVVYNRRRDIGVLFSPSNSSNENHFIWSIKNVITYVSTEIFKEPIDVCCPIWFSYLSNGLCASHRWLTSKFSKHIRFFVKKHWVNLNVSVNQLFTNKNIVFMYCWKGFIISPCRWETQLISTPLCYNVTQHYHTDCKPMQGT